ncbi:DSC E3 ubiquitin ligase complex subunit 1 [Nymphaea thermarum]|nr:DSC E3 ubiquitin ligase complex subunit 1 [Nymphaea thermarum]
MARHSKLSLSRCSSVASCSSDNLLCRAYNRSRTGIRKSLESDDENDATSTCESHTGKKYLGASKKELAVNVQELELGAYCSTLQAFYASGPLNWDQEAILTDLCLSLNISNDEHFVFSWARETPCRHRYHKDCIDKWIENHSICPVCRFQMPLVEENNSAPGGAAQREEEGERRGRRAEEEEQQESQGRR